MPCLRTVENAFDEITWKLFKIRHDSSLQWPSVCFGEDASGRGGRSATYQVTHEDLIRRGIITKGSGNKKLKKADRLRSLPKKI